MADETKTEAPATAPAAVPVEAPTEKALEKAPEKANKTPKVVMKRPEEPKAPAVSDRLRAEQEAGRRALERRGK